MKVVALKTLIIGLPILDEDSNEPVIVEKKWGGVVRRVKATENIEVHANKVLDLDEDTAQELIDGGFAREFDEALDDEDAEV